MPLWTACVRTLSRNRPPFHRLRPPCTRLARWHPLHPLRASSNIASEASPRDDTGLLETPLDSPLYPPVPAPRAPWFSSEQDIDAPALGFGQEEAVFPDTPSPQYPDAQPHEVPAADFAVIQALEWPIRKTFFAWEGGHRRQWTGKWIQEFPSMAERFDSDLTMYKQRGAYLPKLHPQTAEWTEAVLERLDTGKLTLDKSDLPNPEVMHPDDAWIEIALWLLAYDQPRMVDFLLATAETLCPHAIIIQDSLQQLATVFHLSQAPEKGAWMRDLAFACCELANFESEDPVQLKGPTIYHLLPSCSGGEVSRLFQAIEKQATFNPWTHIHFVRYLADHGFYTEALRALSHARTDGVGVDTVAFRGGCSMVLRSSIQQPDGLRETLLLISSMVDLGVELNNIIFFNIIILNAAEAKDPKTAFDVYRSLKERGLEPNEQTFVALLIACKRNIDDVTMLNDVIHDAISNVNVRASQIVADNILHCLAVYHTRKRPRTAFKTLLDAYAQFYDQKPLRRLGLPIPPPTSPRTSANPSSADPLMTPTTHALGFLISAAIQQHFCRQDSRNKNPEAIYPLFIRWCRLLRSGDPIFVPTATVDYIFNIFLSAFTRNSDSLEHAAEIIKIMQSPLIPAKAKVEQAKPTIWTWNIFLQGLVHYGKTELAEQVRVKMREEGVEENIVTWTTMLHGYAGVGDVESTLGMLRERLAEGVEGGLFDTWNTSAVAKLRRKAVRVSELDRKLVRMGLGTSQSQPDFTAELKGGLEQRLKEGGSAESYRPF